MSDVAGRQVELARHYSSIGQYKGPNYDSSALLDAQALIKRFSALYPEEAQQVGLNDALVARLDESAAAEMLQSARWYMKQGDTVSARYTLTRLVEKHPSTAAGTLGLQILTQRGWVDSKTKEPSPAPPAPPAPSPTPIPAEASKEQKP